MHLKNLTTHSLKWSLQVGQCVEGEVILRTSFIKICEVNTHSPFPITFSNHYRIGEPLWVVDFMNKPSLEELVNLRLDCFLSIRCETLELLLDRFFIRLES